MNFSNINPLTLFRLIAQFYHLHHIRKSLSRIEKQYNNALACFDYRRAESLRSVYDQLSSHYYTML